ncbi:MAG: GGDEF domain-containing protein [Campylobacterota bacterium]|nr:GGDEF domain-containing protein [Campylobacterota bacterium]
MTIQTIIKRAVKRLELEGKMLTPDFYEEAFCKEATKSGFIIEDCNKIERISLTLNKEFQKELSQYRIKTMSELSRFLISKLNRTKPSQCSEMVDAQAIFTKKVLQVITLLHNKEASDLARKSLDLLNSNPSASQVDQFKQLWMNFTATYDDTFLGSLKSFGDIDTLDLEKSIKTLSLKTPATKSDNSSDLKKISSLLVSSLVPSISSKVDNKIANISDKIRKKPSLLSDENIEDEIKTAIAIRIALDKESLAGMVESFDYLLDKLSIKLIDIISKSDSSTLEIQKIKTELDTYSEQEATDFKATHKKLYTIASALENNSKGFSEDLKEHSSKVDVLVNRVNELEKELAKTKEESKEDFLTKLYNKRALDEFMKVKEAEFSRYERNYSIVMFDLDLFKLVNDNYGHDAGDAVLSAFAKILKKESRNVDIVGRFGGEEFMAILSETGAKGGAIFAEKVRNHVEKAKFIYKGKRINVTVSCGVAERKLHLSLQNTINSSDEYLYQAKKDGRNQVAYKRS